MCRRPSSRNSQRASADVVRDDASAGARARELAFATPLAVSGADAEVDAAPAIAALGSSTDNATSDPARWTLAMPRWVGLISQKTAYEMRGVPGGSVHVDRS